MPSSRSRRTAARWQPGGVGARPRGWHPRVTGAHTGSRRRAGRCPQQTCARRAPPGIANPSRRGGWSSGDGARHLGCGRCPCRGQRARVPRQPGAARPYRQGGRVRRGRRTLPNWQLNVQWRHSGWVWSLCSLQPSYLEAALFFLERPPKIMEIEGAMANLLEWGFCPSSLHICGLWREGGYAESAKVALKGLREL